MQIKHSNILWAGVAAELDSRGGSRNFTGTRGAVVCK